MNTKERILLYDYLRALAIFLVVIGHFRHLFFPNYHGENKFLFLLTSFGHFGVIIFFGISGILVGKRLQNVNSLSDVKNFILLRLSRIYVVLPFALLLTLILDQIASFFNLYQGIEMFGIISQNSSPEARISLKNFIGNFFSLQTFIFPFFGSNGPLWSLSYEVGFYILGPVFKISKKFRVPILFLLLILNQYEFLMFFLFWYFVPRVKFFKVNTYIFLISTGVLIYTHVEKVMFLDVLYIFYFFILMFYMKTIKLPSLSYIKHLAKISFSLYIYHYPILLFLCFSLFPTDIKSFNWLQMMVTGGLTYLICYLLFSLIEGARWSNNIVNSFRDKI